MKYVAKMDSYVHNHNYPVTKTFFEKTSAIEYIKRALKIYPYVKITLFKNTEKTIKIDGIWKMVRNKRGGLSPRKVK